MKSSSARSDARPAAICHIRMFGSRVRVGSMARALENRMFVAQAMTAGIADGCPILDSNTVGATIHTPVDNGFPDDGILATISGAQNRAIASLDLNARERHEARSSVAVDRDRDGRKRPERQRA